MGSKTKKVLRPVSCLLMYRSESIDLKADMTLAVDIVFTSVVLVIEVIRFAVLDWQ